MAHHFQVAIHAQPGHPQLNLIVSMHQYGVY